MQLANNEFIKKMDKSYKQFVDKLNDYIRKFYLYQLLRGFFLSILLISGYYSFVSGLEYFNYFDPKIKLFIVLITCCLFLFILYFFIAVPVIKLSGMGKRLSYSDVSSKLRKTYPEIKDKLINIVQLANEQNSVYSIELQKASIGQKIEELKIFKFSDAIRFKDLKAVFFIFIALILLLALIYNQLPGFYKESTIRLIHFQQKYEKPAPFTFVLENTDLEIISGESIELKLHCTGNDIPEVLYVNIGGNNFLMSKDGKQFNYSVEHVNSSLFVYFTDKKYISEQFVISVLKKPFISSFTVDIQPPSYTNLKSETLKNTGDLKVVSGTKINWAFDAVDTDSLFLLMNDSMRIEAKKTGNSFEVSRTMFKDASYRIILKNSKLNDENNLIHQIQTISDLFPEIQIVQVSDSTNFNVIHFKGNIDDDYGFSQLDFNLSMEGTDSVIHIPYLPFLLSQDFYFSFNFETVKNRGKSFTYYFSVSDNDFVNHFKRSLSETFTFSFPDYQEISLKETSGLNSIDQLIGTSVQLAEKIQNEIENFRVKQINSELSEWEKFQTVKDIVNKKNELENILNQLKKQNTDANHFLNSFSEENAELLKKQELIENLMNEVFDDELKKLFDEFNELAKQFDSKQFDQLSKQMSSGLDDLAKQLEKNLQLLTKMKVEQKVDRVLQELKKLAESEQGILDKLDNSSDWIQINEEENQNFSHFKTLETDYKDALKLNQTIDKPMYLFNFDTEFSKIEENYSKALENSEKRNKRKTWFEIENNQHDLDQLIFAMDQMLKNNRKKSNKVNMADMKQILDNLIFVSFDQEKLIKHFNVVDYNNPLVNNLKVKQKNLNTQVLFIKDSLYALSKRAPEISSVIRKEMNILESSMNSAFGNLETGNIGASLMYQQYGMTSANNLALFLSEALEKIRNQENQAGEGEEEGDKTGKSDSKSAMGSLKESQNSIKEKLQQMIEQMKKGDGSTLSGYIGQTIAKQEIMQKMIRDMIQNGSVGSKAAHELKAIDELLEQSRKDLINRNINTDLISRHNLILSRLLNAEKSETERDFEDKRESKTALDHQKVSTGGYFGSEEIFRSGKENLKRNNYQLKSFYDQKYTKFLNQLKK